MTALILNTASFIFHRYIQLLARQLGNITFLITYLWSAEHFGFQNIKWEGHFALHRIGLYTAQMTVEMCLADFEAMRLKSMSEPLTQLCDSFRVTRESAKGDSKGVQTGCFHGKLLQWKLPLG